jgi:hypothetical protein
MGGIETDMCSSLFATILPVNGIYSYTQLHTYLTWWLLYICLRSAAWPMTSGCLISFLPEGQDVNVWFIIIIIIIPTNYFYFPLRQRRMHKENLYVYMYVLYICTSSRIKPQSQSREQHSQLHYPGIWMDGGSCSCSPAAAW